MQKYFHLLNFLGINTGYLISFPELFPVKLNFYYTVNQKRRLQVLIPIQYL